MQFVLLMSQALYGTFWATHYRPRIVVELAILQAFIFICLFANFYRCAAAHGPRDAWEAQHTGRFGIACRGSYPRCLTLLMSVSDFC